MGSRACRIVFLSLVLLSACSADLTVPPPDGPLVGTWDHAAVVVGDRPVPDIVWDGVHGGLVYWDYGDPLASGYFYAEYDFTFGADGTVRRTVTRLKGRGGVPETSPAVVTEGAYALEGDMLHLWTGSYEGEQTRLFAVTGDTLVLMDRDPGDPVTWYLTRHVEE